MNKSKILNFILAAAIVVMAIQLSRSGKPSEVSQTPIDSVSVAMNMILTRTSVRSYTDQPVDSTQVEQLLRAAMAAPSARNCQPWNFTVVRDTTLLQALAAASPYAKMTAEAAVAIVVSGDLSLTLEGDAAAYWIQDASAATENLLLAAHAHGLGAVWTGVYPIAERIQTVRNVLNLPKNLIPLNVIVIGYPNEPQHPKDKWDPEKIHENAW